MIINRLFNIILLLVALGFPSLPAQANTYDNISTDGTGIHRIGNYNVRYTNDDSDVTAGWAWSNRKTNLIQLIKDIDFDLLGLEEVTGETDQGNQLSDIADALWGTYSWRPVERSQGVVDGGYSYNILAYKTSKYECLEQGHFWLSPTPETAGSYGWEYATYGTSNDSGAAIARTCVWMKLRVKSGSDAGQVLVFAMAHSNAGKLLDGPESGKLITARLSQYADELADAYGLERGTVPVVLVGDLNLDRRRGVNQHAYREYMTYFSDAALAADSKKVAPYTNSNSSVNQLTTTGFTPMASATDGSIYDYVFYRNIHATSYCVITETYGNAKNPSDHYPVYINCTLGHNAPKIYVNANAAAGGDGSKSAPFQTLTEAKRVATAGSTVYVTADTYNESFELSSPVEFIGGYDSQYENIIGKTTIDGSGKNFAVKAKRNGLYFSNFKICNTTSPASAECGAIYSTGAEVKLYNVEFCDNTIAAATYTDNSTAYLTKGGALHTAARDVEITDCYFHDNSAASGAALCVEYIDASVSTGDWGTETVRISGSTFAENSTLTASGARGAVDISLGNVGVNANLWNNTFVNNTFNGTSGSGSAIYIYSKLSDALINIGHNTIVGNKSTVTGEAFVAYRGQLSLVNNIMAGNSNANKAYDGTHDAFVNTSVTTIKKSQYNLFTCATSASSALFDSNDTDFYAVSDDASVTNYTRGLAALTELLDGYVSDGKFIAILAVNGGNTPTVKVNAKTFDGKAVDKLSNTLRDLESIFATDLNGDGDTSDRLTTDQRGSHRLTNSVPGACEFVPLPLVKYFIISGSEGKGTKSGYSWDNAAPESKLQDLLYTAKVGSTFYFAAGEYNLYSHLEIPEGIALQGGFYENLTGRNTDISYEGTLAPSYDDSKKTIFNAAGQNDGMAYFIIGNPNVASGQYTDYYGGALNTGSKVDFDRVLIQGITIRNAVNTSTAVDYPGSAMLITHAIARLDHVIIEDNTLASEADTRPRGGVVMVRGSYFYAVDCAWRNNASASNGSALNVRQRESKGDTNETDRSVVILERCEFTDNIVYNASATYGGAIVMGDYAGTIYMNNCTATGTSIKSNGAFARIGTNTKFFSTNNTFYNCTASGDLKGVLSLEGGSQAYFANTIVVNPSYASGNNNAAVYMQNAFTSKGYNVWGTYYAASGTTVDTDKTGESYTTAAVFGSNALGVDTEAPGNGLQVIAPLSTYRGMTLSELKKLAVEWVLPDEVDVTRDQRGYYRNAGNEGTYCGAYDLGAIAVRPVGKYFVDPYGVNGSSGDGSSWDNPLAPRKFAYLLENAPVGDIYYVKEGLYQPIFTNSTSGSVATYRPWSIPEGVTILGGYPSDFTGENTTINYPSAHETIFTADYDGDGVGDNGDFPFVWLDNSDGSKDTYQLTTIKGITFRDAFSTCESRKYYHTPVFIENANVEFGWCNFLNNVTGYLIKHEADYYQLSPKEGYASKGSNFKLPGQTTAGDGNQVYTTPVYEAVGAGGAVTTRASKVYFHDCIWRGNQTTHGGAALCIRQIGGNTSSNPTDVSIVKVERCEFTDNILPVQDVIEKEAELYGDGQPTGYYRYYDELARYGGAISVADYGGTLYMINSTISGSHVQRAGGAVRIGSGAEFHSMSNTFFDCTAPKGGGAILSIGSNTKWSISNTIAVNDEADLSSSSPEVYIQATDAANIGTCIYNVFGSTQEANSSSAFTDESNDLASTNSMQQVFVTQAHIDAGTEDESKMSQNNIERHFDNDRYPGFDYFAIGHDESYVRESGIDHSGTYVMTPSRVYYDKYYCGLWGEYSNPTCYGSLLIKARREWGIPCERGGEVNVFVDQRNFSRTSSTVVGAYDPYATRVTTEIADVASRIDTFSVTSMGNGCYRISGVEGTCRVFDLSGQIISTDYVADGSVIDLSEQARGVYILNVDNKTAKIIK